ncbi:uncharacterized protein METZ01_LOCUS269919, partial [marine metagenome]
VPGECIAGGFAETLQIGVQPDRGTCRQLYQYMPAIDTHRVEAFTIGLLKTDFTKAMFTESAGLHDEASGFVSVAIHQLHAHATIAQLVNEGGRVRWQPRSLTIGVVVTNRGTK